MTTTTREAYCGTRRKLILAFDLGTTFSGVSYAVLDPGIVPEIKGVTRFPSQENVGSNAKIPTIMYYDKGGNVQAIGAEALKESVIEMADENDWFKCEGFKLHLRPETASDGTPLSPLPPGKAVLDLFTDFYAYVFDCAKTFILESQASAATFWDSVKDEIDFVLTHPNGWEGIQQGRMRQAAVNAGLVTAERSQQAIRFVTEGEASLHFCISHGLSKHIRAGEGVVIVDAGGGTVDISAYTPVSEEGSQLLFEEIAAPQCHFTGSMFVTTRAKLFLAEKLKDSRFLTEVANMAEVFDKTTKLRFNDLNEIQYIRFGTMRDKDVAVNIARGQLKLSGEEVASFFEPSVSSIIQVVDEQRLACKNTVSAVFLVGGFAASYWLFEKLKDHLGPLGISFSRPDSHVSKAVADGAVSFYLDRSVGARIAKYTYGVSCNVLYNEGNKDHLDRKAKLYMDTAGHMRVPLSFGVILPKNTKVSEVQEFREPFHQSNEVLSKLHSIQSDILYYKGSLSHPKWIDVEPDMFPSVCIVTADTSKAAKSLPLKRRADGKPYFVLNYDIILLFGGTEITAQVAWKEKGVEKRGPARIVYGA
ncbi:hypothetical protein BDZ89DRAFT_1068051 [Hymenopellis radicata]|nr:hypothetical protein BDZ89DRAFT_1068051 [Hymenopellis radicata]